jgi:uncharacterized protein
MYYALTYDAAPDYLERRQEFRSEHLALADEARREGRLVMAGAFDPPTGALLVFRGESPAEAEEFARRDPYVRNGLVKSWRVQGWRVVVGGDARDATTR